MKEYTVGENEAGKRLDKLLTKVLNQAPAGFVYKMLRKKNIKLNDKKADGHELLAVGDRIQIYLSDETFDKFHADTVVAGSPKDTGKKTAVDRKQTLRELSPADIIYEDEDVLILNKPAGVLSQKADVSDDSMNEQMLRYLLKKGSITSSQLQTFTPSVCNRLDRNTSGLVLAGKSLAGSRGLSVLLRERSLQKYYLALVDGKFEESMRKTAYLLKDRKANKVRIYEHLEECRGADGEPQQIVTEYRPIAVTARYTLLEVHLITGKSHQIRAHLAYLGHAIVGDAKYGDRGNNQEFRNSYHIQNQCLHAWRVEFPKETDANNNEFPAGQLKVMGNTYYAPLPYKTEKAYMSIFGMEIMKQLKSGS